MVKKDDTKKIKRPPIVVVMGHVDHGKSTLLDYIRKSNVVRKESGGITQHIYSYEINHTNKDGNTERITFLDTPGHEAFTLMRARGVAVADIAILVVAADDGVKTQTQEALHTIKEAGIPYVVAINKIDLPHAQVDKVKQELSENDVFLEGYGGDVPNVVISAKTGSGIAELLELVLLMAELEELKGNPTVHAEGTVIESNRDSKKGISAILLIQNGILKKGMCVVAGEACSPVRRIDNFLGKELSEATFSSPVRITGFNIVPKVGSSFASFTSKKEAEKYIVKNKEEKKPEKVESKKTSTIKENHLFVPLIVKSDTEGTLEAVLHEIEKISIENLSVIILNKAVGVISETDIKRATGAQNPIIVGFNVTVEKNSAQIAKQLTIPIKTFSVIYKLTEWLHDELEKRKPKIKSEKMLGRAKIIRIFSKTKDKQVIGGKVKEGSIASGSVVKILRRDFEIDRGKLLELQQQKVKINEVGEGVEFGAMIEAKHEIAEGDYIESFVVVEK